MNLTLKTICLWLTLGLLLCSGRSVQAQSDDFNDGDDNGWTEISPLAPYGVPGIFSFPNGGYRIQTTQPSPDQTNLGPPRAYTLRQDAVYTDFYVSADLVDWNDGTQQVIGLVGRIATPGLGTSSG